MLKEAKSHITVFSENALEAIVNAGNGIPRIINKICDASLLIGHNRDIDEISTNTSETWTRKINYLKDYGNHYEIRIESRSGIDVIFGCSSAGNFVCVPNFNVGCHLAHLKDKFWNQEKLTSILGEVDGITLTEALFNVYD